MKNRKVPKLRFKEFTEEWEEKKLGEISIFINGKGHEQIIEENGKYIVVNSKFISSNGVIKKYTSNLLVPLYVNDILMVMSDVPNGKAIGKCFLVDENNKYSLNQRICALRSKENSKYLYYILNRNSYFLKFDDGISQTNLKKNEILDCPILLPILEEQQKIADFLSCVDTKISLTEEKLENLKIYKKGIMQKIFSQEIRFKDKNGNDYPEWEEKQVSNIFKITRGYVLSKTEIKNIKENNYIYPVYSSQTLNNGLMGFYNQWLYENSITWTTDGANAGTVKFREEKFYCTNVCGVLISEIYNNKCIAEILSLEAPKYVSYVGNPKLMNNVMGKIKIIIPLSLQEQQKIADFLSSIDDKIEKTENGLNELKGFKKGLLQKMFV